MAGFFWYLVKRTCLEDATVHVYTGKATLNKVPEKHGHAQLVTLYLAILMNSPTVFSVALKLSCSFVSMASLNLENIFNNY